VPEQSECRKFSAQVEVVLDVDVVEGSVKKFWANNPGMVRNALEDMLTIRGFTRHYGDGMKLKVCIENISCTAVSERGVLDA